MASRFLVALLALTLGGFFSGCHCSHGTCATDSADRFMLRPQVEQQYGYTHAIRIGDTVHVSGAVSMDDNGNPTAADDLNQQVRNCYRDLEIILGHYGCSFGDVIVENIYTTDMPGFLQVCGYRAEIYGDRYPTGTWVEVKGLALPEFMIEIELEVHVPKR